LSVVVGPRVVDFVATGRYGGPWNVFVVVIIGLRVVVMISQLGLLAPLVQQYFPFPPFSQQSWLLAPFKQQYLPVPPLGQAGFLVGVVGGGFVGVGAGFVGVGAGGAVVLPVSLHSRFSAPFVQQYWLVPPLVQQNSLLAPLVQQNSPRPPFVQQSGPDPPLAQQSRLLAPFKQQNGPLPPDGQGSCLTGGR
jgi:hypothetical protein